MQLTNIDIGINMWQNILSDSIHMKENIIYVHVFFYMMHFVMYFVCVMYNILWVTFAFLVIKYAIHF